MESGFMCIDVFFNSDVEKFDCTSKIKIIAFEAN